MKKIVFVSGRLGGGGSERVLTLVANQLRLRGHEVSIITFGEYANPYDNACPVVSIKYHGDVDQVRQMRAQLKRLAPDTVIAFEYYIGMKTVLAAAGLKMRVIVSERNDPHKLDSNKPKRLLRDLLYARADLLVCQTDDAQAYFAARHVRNTTVICNPLKAGLPAWAGDACENVIINYCKLEKQKNLPLLLDAFAQVHARRPGVQLHLYGEGTEEAALRSRIHELDLDEAVTLRPFANNIHEIAARCSLFVSSSDFEGLSNSMLEAMAMGMPVVCTDCPIGGARMIIRDGENGLLVPVRDCEALAQAMDRLLTDQPLRRHVSREASRLKDELTLEKITQKWENIL